MISGSVDVSGLLRLRGLNKVRSGSSQQTSFLVGSLEILYTYISTYLHVYMLVYLYLHISIALFIYIYICIFFIYLSIHPSIYLLASLQSDRPVCSQFWSTHHGPFARITPGFALECHSLNHLPTRRASVHRELAW